jgi:hypothetical protein
MAAARSRSVQGSSASEAAPGTTGAPSRWARLMFTLSLCALVATYLAAQVDFLRRHQPGITPVRYWLPQATHIWAPGLGATFVLAVVGLLLARRR